jgi:hypothetical protein
MKDQDWKKLKHFNKSEFNHPEKMDLEHLIKLDKMRQNIGFPIIVTSDYRANDSGTHGEGLATDVIFPTRDLSDLYYLYCEAERHNFSGIGIYPHWHYNGIILGGLHLDSRPLENGRGSRWIAILKDGEQKYIKFSWENMTRYVIS